MKKLKYLSLMLLCAAMVLSFSACSDDDDEVVNDTTYTFTYSALNPPDGFEIDITLFEYNADDERIGQKNVNDVRVGYSEQFVASPNAQKVKVYIETSYGNQSNYDWVQQVYYLTPGSDTEINITGDIRVGKVEP